ncbi:MAG: T9SS type A sorting domain-containing protein [Ignavibacteriales bacterium]|nr:T9SS type A sorting domain-containing protein [Ignavibacteriales bacterium]
MQKLYCCVLILFLAAQNIFAQQIDKIIISGYGGQHDLDVKTSFLLGYESYNNTPFTGEVILYSNTLQSSYDYAVANDYDLIIRSTSGLSTGLRLAPDYPSIELVMPAGSNIYTQVFFGDVLTSPVVITGAGIDSNMTGYRLEFYSKDPITLNNYSSFSNGYVAGQLAFVANKLNCSFDSARALARAKGSENGNWDMYNGFGEVKPENIITDPLPVELTSFSAKIIGKTILLKWQTATEINNFGFEIERKILNQVQNDNTGWEKIGFVNGNGNSNSPKDYSFIDKNPDGVAEIKYRLKQIDNDGRFEYSDIINVYFLTNDFELYQNYPNPFNPSTTISWQSKIDGNVSIKIFDILGNEIAELINEFKPAGKHELKFESNTISIGLPSGIYIYKIEIKTNELLYTMNRKMTLIK